MSQLFISCAPAMEPLLVDELATLGIPAKPGRGGVRAEATLENAYRICLWSRLASRVLWPLIEGPAQDAEDIYALASQVLWPSHFDVSCRFAVDFTGSNNEIRHTQFGAMKIKDAIVDVFREERGKRPEVDLKQPNIRVNAHLGKQGLAIYLDLAGKPLHQRGYRASAGEAPLKESLAAAILYKLGWHKDESLEYLVDPMCGSGTLVIEAALMRGKRAPGLKRDFAFMNWAKHDPALWNQEVKAAIEAALPIEAKFFGFDSDKKVIEKARNNAKAAGVGRALTFNHQALKDLGDKPGQRGLILCNPPYGERLGDMAEVLYLYRELGVKARNFMGWRLGVYTGAPESLRQLKLLKANQWQLNNGAIECVLASYELDERQGEAKPDTETVQQAVLTGPVEAFANRLKKNIKALEKWAKREGIDAYRLYDADLPEYNAAVDRYGDWIVIQEYAPPKTIEPEKAARRLQDLIVATVAVTGVKADKIAVKTRAKQSGSNQYEKLESRQQYFWVEEYGVRCKVNLFDYLDSGLFLDHRLTRKWVGEMAKGKRFLNLFCYTGTATVHAAKGGAMSTTSVDMSRTYLDWAEANLRGNGFTGREHQLVQANCLDWLNRTQEKFDLVFVDPPTFSNSKRMEGNFDVQRDHVELLERISHLLVPGAVVVFSNNKRHFKLEKETVEALGYQVEDVSKKTLPEDYKRNPHIHVCFKLVFQP
ncbi:bifunctional 23S rRNA (guanine(2069)-N(7))-methyltransferase RlmK/23S rRNA (guanine(2445)-N(2))-methyltransferase RlmL [Gallaecimonas kandeliae]|uniref:bifunctional 23S rRNA (guanine(2069)-N(7))-methyltransferase RlmK/23S rRNA (guanine(2445)-N(2))-methyltransferase RlmL n=1 Tax=Gallaecimonas kandeliae TaxID=3029055 RepID=UPI0026478A07|nr:bifunctional 23S rRNA (guanine(2069)-N(7))-methyltransferase RlmK/23S rRNA (guanine(2445)-N(2))-methyltransferase RlmL [Gallaecimonas kandeliae]WKE67362.1 bifunctional 23S rRNA (guanine(2069)-N(7))-methyltransferase RlmK/23S rRNA (guanine(2445)-N(2))-methyltransferase RlmL [Gallaecimonas kandeliae]